MNVVWLDTYDTALSQSTQRTCKLSLSSCSCHPIPPESHPIPQLLNHTPPSKLLKSTNYIITTHCCLYVHRAKAVSWYKDRIKFWNLSHPPVVGWGCYSLVRSLQTSPSLPFPSLPSPLQAPPPNSPQVFMGLSAASARQSMARPTLSSFSFSLPSLLAAMFGRGAPSRPLPLIRANEVFPQVL